MVITIDTNIIIFAFNEQEPVHRDVVGLIGRNGRKLGCDANLNGTILREYKNKVGENQGYKKWIKRLLQLDAIRFQSTYNISRSHKDRLYDLQCRGQSDLVFIGVAYHSGKILISEDSDVGKGPKGYLPPHCDALQYLTENMGLTVLDAQEACDYFDIILTKGIS